MHEKKIKSVAIVPSAGLGKRMGGTRKNYLELASLPILVHTLRALAGCEAIDSIIVVTASGDEEFCKEEIIKKYGIKKIISIVAGGATRQDSVANGIKAAAAGSGFSIVVVHDGARPLITADVIERCILEAEATGAAIAAVHVKDTIKEVSSGIVTNTLARNLLWAVQTPQAFRLDLLQSAHTKAAKERFIGTDSASIVERLGAKVTIIESSYENIKITTPEDLAVAAVTFAKRAAKTEEPVL